MHVILMGAQGSGKGTQAALLGPQLKLEKIATGDLFRAEIGSGSELGKELKLVLDRGDLVQDELTTAIVRARIGGIVSAQQSGVDVNGALFDGFPRTAAQAGGLDAILNDFSQQITAVVEIDVPRDILIRRLSGRRVCVDCGTVYHADIDPPKDGNVCTRCGGRVIQRDDDKPQPIARRLTAYDEQTAPLLAYYGSRGLVDQVDGNRPVPDVNTAILEIVRRRNVEATS